MMLRNLTLHLTVGLLLAWGSFYSAALAQTASGSVPVSGIVQDSSGAAVAAARVTLQQAGKTAATTKTDGSGAFRFEHVARGAYQVSVELDGFQPASATVVVGAKAPAPVGITLGVAAVHQQVTVSGSVTAVSTDTSENLSGAVLKGEDLSNLPVFDQDYIGTMSLFLDDSEVGTSGATLIVDGMEVNDLGVSPSAVQEIKINQNPYDAQYPRPGWGRIEVTTKAGQDAYHGTFNFIFRDAILNARNAFAVVRPPEQRRIFEGSLLGPVGHSQKTSFLFSANRKSTDSQSIVSALGPSGIIQANVPSPFRNLNLFGRIEHAVSDFQSFSLSYSYYGQSMTNSGVGGLTLPQAGYNTQFREDQIRFSHRLILSTHWVNDFRALLGQYRAPTVSLSSAPAIVVQGAFTGGGAQADQVRTERHFTINEIVSYSQNKHTLKGGVQIPDWSRRGFTLNTNTGGTFYFSSLQDYQAQQPYAFSQQQGNGHLVFYEKVLAGFVQDDYRVRPDLMVSLGVRYDWQNYFYDNHRFAPRMAFAWSPRHSRTTVIRGGMGVFYDRTGPGPISNLLLYDGHHRLNYLFTNPGYPDPLGPGGTLASEPVSTVELDPNFTSPYMLHFSLGLERQISAKSTLTVTYSNSRGVHQFFSRDINAPLPPLYGARPDSAFGAIRQYEAAGRRVNNSLRVQYRGELTHYFTGMAQYRLGSAHDNTDGIGYYPSNQYDLSGEWARSNWDRRNNFELLGTFRPGKLLNLGMGLSLRSGSPYTMTTGLDNYHDGMANERPLGVPRNSLQSTGFAAMNLRWSKDFRLVKSKGEKGPTLTPAVDAFNVTNRVNFGGYVGNLTSPLFGLPTYADSARRLQLSIRFQF